MEQVIWVCVSVYRDLEYLAKCQPCCHYLMNFNMSGFTISPELKTSFYIFKPSYLDSILIKYWCVHIRFKGVQSNFHRFNFARNKFWICKNDIIFMWPSDLLPTPGPRCHIQIFLMQKFQGLKLQSLSL